MFKYGQGKNSTLDTDDEIFVDRMQIILGIGIFGGRTVSLHHKQKEDQWNTSAL